MAYTQKNNNSLTNESNEINKPFDYKLLYVLITWLALALTAILDPCWKINHLYSMELFPTQVRNMSRGFCNVAARAGSLAGPLVSFYYYANFNYKLNKILSNILNEIIKQ